MLKSGILALPVTRREVDQPQYAEFDDFDGTIFQSRLGFVQDRAAQSVEQKSQRQFFRVDVHRFSLDEGALLYNYLM